MPKKLRILYEWASTVSEYSAHDLDSIRSHRDLLSKKTTVVTVKQWCKWVAEKSGKQVTEK